MAAIDLLKPFRLRPAGPRTVNGTVPQRAGVASIIGVLGAVLCVAAVAVAAAGSRGDAAFGRGLLEALIVGTPIIAGVYALRAPGNARFGVALLAIGFFWSFTALGQTTASIPYTIGRLATWCVFPCVVYLLLAFPDGRIAPGLDRVMLLGMVGVLVFLFLGTAPLVEAYPPKTLWATCTTDCPANALFALDQQPAWLPRLILFREWAVEVLWLGLFWSMWRRWRAATPLQRRAVGPVFAAGAFLGAFHIAHITYRQLGGPADTVIALSSAWTLCIVGICATFLVGLVRRRTMLARTLATLGAALRTSGSSAEVRDALATALRDSTIEALFRDKHSREWRDTSGRSVAWPLPLAAERAVTTIGAENRNLEVALVHDPALRDDPDLLDGVGGMVLAAWRHDRMIDELAGAMSDLDESRRRLTEAADLERVRIQRDLHDGAQQRLVALRVRLGLAEEQLETDPAAGINAVRELGFEAERALDQLRSLAHGVYPSLLTDHGLPDALRSLAWQAPLPIHVSADDVTRHPIELESAVYFTCAEAVQNAMKHAVTASAIWVTLRQSSTALQFEVRDDGVGFVATERFGRGMHNMYDRIGAVGGDLAVEAIPGRGTLVAGSVDLH
jgi:signal transduction histidine kinase